MNGTPKKKLLVIAPEIPRPDWNSGDLRLFSMLRLLCGDYAILYLPLRARKGGERYQAELEALGVTVMPVGTPLAAICRRHRFQAAIIEFYLHADYFLPRLRLLKPDCRVIIDSVDVHFLREEMAAALTGDPALKAQAERTRRAELEVYAQADLVLTVTSDDGQAVTGACPQVRVRVVPNIHQLVPGEGSVKEHDLVFVGGFQHAPNVDAMLFFCREVLPLIRRRHPGVTLAIVGSNPPEQVLALAEPTVTVTGYVPSTTPYLHGSRVSIAPLRIGAGMKGKVGEAMAHRIPVVTTSVGAQGMGLRDGEHVLIADEPAAFADAVVRLLGDPALAGRLQARAADHLCRHYSPERVGSCMKEILDELESMPPRKLTLRDTARFLGGWLADRFPGLAGEGGGGKPVDVQRQGGFS